ncbi:hypothetical protein AAFF_G00414300 [Aldrovandia affinis]|uniref:Uncharacterized protein n=1 Tax=Aldrovandia affinis TaxID=143900 RepID=A0AAD7SCZ6_9TELE|nr:hypothetical protein AAFF_G00414300 [Aldrovandia affinis]
MGLVLSSRGTGVMRLSHSATRSDSADKTFSAVGWSCDDFCTDVSAQAIIVIITIALGVKRQHSSASGERLRKKEFTQSIKE